MTHLNGLIHNNTVTKLMKNKQTKPQSKPAAAALALIAASATVSAEPTLQTGQHIITTHNEFAFKLHQRLSQQAGEKNLFFSPYSLTAALALAQAGADGETAEEIAKLIGLSANQQELADSFNQLYPANHASPLKVANAIWIKQDKQLLPGYLEATKSLNAHARPLDFENDPQGSSDTINNWVAGKTNDKVQNLISADAIRPDTELILTNAIHFKDDWRSPFKTRATQQKIFNLPNSTTTSVATMHQTDHFGYFEDDQIKLIEMNYENSPTSMVAILPKPGHSLSDIEASLTYDKFFSWCSNAETEEVTLALPKFKIDWTSDKLEASLQSLGLEQAFKFGQANFSKIDGTRNLYIGAVIQKAFIEVDETGTEAAAATALTMRSGSMFNPPPPKEFNVDRPFLFVIRNPNTNAILFIGKVNNPN